MTFAEKVKSALKNYQGLSGVVRKLEVWKYIIKNNPEFYRFRFDTSSNGIVVEGKAALVGKSVVWIQCDKINESNRKTIGDWIK